MKLNFRKYSDTLAVYRDFSLSFIHGGMTRQTYRELFTLTRQKCGGRLTPEVEMLQDSSLWGLQQKAEQLGFEIVIPANFPQLPKR